VLRTADDKEALKQLAVVAASPDTILSVNGFAKCTRLSDFLQLPSEIVQQCADHGLRSSPLDHSTTLDRQRARGVLEFLLQPMLTVAEFYKVHWEQTPVHVSCHAQDVASRSRFGERLDGFLSLPSIRRILETSKLSYGRDISMTRYKTVVDTTGVTIQRRVTLDKVAKDGGNNSSPGFGLARPAEVLKQLDAGSAIGLLRPQEHSTPIRALLTLLEHEWGCEVGANVLSTAPRQETVEDVCSAATTRALAANVESYCEGFV
jgi:hypothetical protein